VRRGTLVVLITLFVLVVGAAIIQTVIAPR
jgi:hypothetical protein